MSAKKLTSDEVPQKFIEWVLALGCPREKIPSIDKMTGMCRGQYYMTWRSMMEHVQPRDEISHKRLTVFYDDIKKCQEKKLLNETGSSAVLPEQLSLWKDHSEIHEKVREAEECANNARVTLNELMDRVSSKVIQRDSLRQRIADLQRRHWLLNQVSNELQTKIANIEETRSIANSLCNVEKGPHDVKSQLEDCIARLRKSQPSALPLSTPVACSSINSNHESESTSHDKDERVFSLVSCRGDALWPHLYDKLSSLYSQLSDAYATHTDVGNNRSDTRSMLAHTAALHSILALEAIKNRVHIQRAEQQLLASIKETSKHISEDASELLVVRAQRVFCEARVKSLKASLEELVARSGVFHSADDRSDAVDAQATLGKIACINKCIVKSREEIKRLTLLSAHTERKIYNIRECLLAVFSALHNNTDIRDNALSAGVQLDFPTDSVLLIRQFYTKRCERDGNNDNSSFNLEISDVSTDYVSVNPTFVDELNIYLKKFNLEKNRKLVLDSGEKIWIFETLLSLSSRLCARWASDDVTSLLCPTLRASRALRHLRDVTERHALVACAQRTALHATGVATATNTDIAAMTNHEDEVVDKMKKSITENRNLLQKVQRNLDICKENLNFWSEQQIKKYISTDRTVGGMTYREYEKSYMEKLSFM